MNSVKIGSSKKVDRNWSIKITVSGLTVYESVKGYNDPLVREFLVVGNPIELYNSIHRVSDLKRVIGTYVCPHEWEYLKIESNGFNVHSLWFCIHCEVEKWVIVGDLNSPDNV